METRWRRYVRAPSLMSKIYLSHHHQAARDSSRQSARIFKWLSGMRHARLSSWRDPPIPRNQEPEDCTVMNFLGEVMAARRRYGYVRRRMGVSTEGVFFWLCSADDGSRLRAPGHRPPPHPAVVVNRPSSQPTRAKLAAKSKGLASHMPPRNRCRPGVQI